MRETYLKLIDVESIRDDQALQLSLPLRFGGCGLRSHTINELQRLFVSSALLVAPAVLAATGLPIKPSDPAEDIDADHFSPFECQLQSSIENLESQGISRPDFEHGGPIGSDVWASTASD